VDIEVRLSDEDIGENRLTIQYPEVEGSATTDFAFNATLINNYSTEQAFAFAAEAPPGWTVTFTPTGATSQVPGMILEPRRNQGITINVRAPDDVESGSHAIHVGAVTTGGDILVVELTITITDSHEIRLTTPDGRLSFDAQVNVEAAVSLRVSNTGNAALPRINLTSSAPPGWSVRFETTEIENLAPGEEREVIAYVTPGSNALTGDYLVNINASGSNTSASAQFRVTVTTQTIWGVLAVIIIIVVAVLLLMVFRKYGRR